MNKYTNLWIWIQDHKTDDFELSFSDIEQIIGFPVDHSFLKYKKELIEFGFEIDKISIKEQVIRFKKILEND